VGNLLSNPGGLVLGPHIVVNYGPPQKGNAP
jgi:hypothetical protein